MTSAVPSADLPPSVGDRVRAAVQPLGWLTLLALVAAIYAQTARFAFVDYDDQDYVFANPHVRTGLSTENWVWAWTTGHAANWHPLTWLSLQLDVALFGVSPGAMHLVNAAFHALNAGLVFALLSRLLRDRGRSWIVAAIFACHPLRAESVAWVSERKDVLSTCFFLLSLLAYVRWTRSRQPLAYAASVVAFIASLLSKPMFVTLPAILVLLDVWPLRRLASSKARLAIEKIPFAALAGAAAVVTMRVQSAGHAIWTRDAIPLPLRLLNACASATRYLELTVWPAGLAAYHPHPFGRDGDGRSAAAKFLALAVPVLVTLAAFSVRRSKPIALFGWIWFLVLLIPVIGIVQVGNQGYAERYTYAPSIGLLAAIVWIAADRVPLRVGQAIAAAAIAIFGVLSFGQVGMWRTSIALAEQGVRAEPTSATAWNTLAVFASESGDATRAEPAFRRSLSLRPADASVRANFAGLLIRAGRLDEAREQLDAALASPPPTATAWLAEGDWQFARGDAEAGFRAYERGLSEDPRLKEGWHNFAVELSRRGRWDEAVEKWHRAVETDPEYVSAWLGLSAAALRENDAETARRTARRAFAIRPGAQEAAAVARAFCVGPATPAELAEAERLARRASAARPTDPEPLATLAKLLIRRSRPGDARPILARAIELSARQGDEATRERLEQLRRSLDENVPR